MLITASATFGQDCTPSSHFYIGGGIGFGTSDISEGFVVNANLGYATRVLGVDGSITTYPNPSAPSIFAAHLTKPFFNGVTKITIGAGAAYQLVTVDHYELNGWKGSAYFEVARQANYRDMAVFARAQVTGTNFILTVGIQGIFKKQ